MAPLLDIRDLVVEFHTKGEIITAVDNVSLTIDPGMTLGLVGESGCGKSVTASAVMGLVPTPPGKIAQGQILYEGQNLVALPESKMKRIRGNQISMIFQEPMTSLNPVFTVGDQVAEVFRLHQGLKKKQALDQVVDMFRLVGIPAPENRIGDYPYQMSGGMRQRVMIAMALACRPRIMIADEPTTALDVTIQAQILELMNKLKEETGSSILFITHDLGVIAETAQHVAVMYAGKVMEYAAVGPLFAQPLHPYTVGLLGSIPKIGSQKHQKRLNTIKGVVPSLFNLPQGCLFSDRCPDVFDRCPQEKPPLYPLEDRQVRCFKYDPGR